MTYLEKLVDLINKSFEDQHAKRRLLTAVHTAEDLLANGVVVQQWRDAKTDPPPQDEDVLLRFCNGKMVVGGLREDGGWYSNIGAEWYTDCDTIPEKWMSLSEVTKEETK
jgi:hypothetical protein